MTGSLFVLSGEDLTLPFSEVRALIQTYAPKEACECIGKRVVISRLSDPLLLSKITSRSAYCRFGGHLVSIVPASDPRDLKSLKSLLTDGGAQIPEGKTFAVISETLDREVWKDLGAELKSITGAKVSLENPDFLYQVEKTETGLVLGRTNAGYKKFSWRERRPRARKFFLPSAIYPKLARLLVNLSRVREGELFSDPFCGTGSLLIEAAIMGIQSVGMDRGRWISKGALKNMKGFRLDSDSLIMRGDSTFMHLPLEHLDAVATDVPYGRASSTKGKSTRSIIKEFTSTLAETMTNNSSRKIPKYAVIMRPSKVELELERKSFQVEEEHLMYVHRNLTRAITVLRRV